MGWFRKKLTPQQLVAARVDGRELQYAVKRYTDQSGSPQEIVLGRGGRVDTAAGHVILIAGDKDVFVNNDINTLECGELMALNGVRFAGRNELTGEDEVVVAYYKQYL